MSNHSVKKRKCKAKKGNNYKTKKIASSRIISEKKMLTDNFNKIDKENREERRKEEKKTSYRRTLRERYLKSLEIGDLKVIELAKQSMLGYEIDLKIREQNNATRGSDINER